MSEIKSTILPLILIKFIEVQVGDAAVRLVTRTH